MRSIVLSLIVTLSVVLGSALSMGMVAAKPPPSNLPQWLFLEYDAWDNDLDFASPQYDTINAIYKLNNFISGYTVASSDVVTIAMMDRFYNWYDGGVDSGNHNARIYRASYQSLSMIQDCGELDCSNPQTLSGFLVWAVTTYPAAKYSLTVNTHGNGWQGVCSDAHGDQPDQVPTRWMDMLSMKTALSDAESAASFKLDVITFNACLMQDSEVAFQLKDCAKVMVGSEESAGLRCTDEVISRLIAVPSTDALGLGLIWVEENVRVPGGSPGAMTISAIDLVKVGTAVSQLQKFGSFLTGFLKDPDPVKAQGYRDAVEYCRNTVCQFNFDVYDFVDLYHFTSLCYACSQSGQLPNAKLFVQSMTGLQSAIIAMTIAESHDYLEPYYEHAYSVSIYYPLLASDWSFWKTEHLLLDISSTTGAPAWNGFISEMLSPAGPAPTVPGAPQSLGSWASPADQGIYIALSWLAPLSDGGSPILQYNILRSTRSGAERQFATVPSSSLGFTDFSVRVGVTYYYKVQAVNAVGAGPLSVETWNTVADPRP